MLWLVALALAAHGEFGPIPTRNHRALALAYLRLDPRPAVVEAGRWRWEVGLTAANDFRRTNRVDEDYEVTRLDVRATRGIGAGWDVWAEGSLSSRWGGVLDPIIDAWHARVLGWSDRARRETPFGRTVIAEGGRHRFGAAAGLGDLAVGASRKLDERTTLRLGVEAPLGDPRRALGSGGWDAGVLLAHHVPIAPRWSAYLAGSLVSQGASARLDTRRVVDAETLALVWSPTPGQEWVLQWGSEASPTRTGVTAPHRLLTVGHRGRIRGGWWEAYLSEDRDLTSGRVPEISNVGPDVTVGVRFVFTR